MEKYEVRQDHEGYLPEDHATWATLIARQNNLTDDLISSEYLDGYRKLKLDRNKIVKISDLSDRLESLSGWKLEPVTGLIPTKDFFCMLINKRYPITVFIRKPWEIDFSEQPDIFHDVCGHLPLLVNDNFAKFLTAYSTIALKYAGNSQCVDLLGRLYWYTYEMGIINEGGTLKPYGGAVITSSEEMANYSRKGIPKHPFDLEHIFNTDYNPYKLQDKYFYINSFDDLFSSVEQIEEFFAEHLVTIPGHRVIRNYSINRSLGKGFNNVIGFLNDIQSRFPDAISFAAGQPDEHFFDVERHLKKFATYVEHVAGEKEDARSRVANKICQYGKTKGIINDIVARYLKKDENIAISGNDILITVGAQEAFAIIIATICNREDDIILVEDPSYIGLSSFARIFEYQLEGVKTDENGIDVEGLQNILPHLNAGSKKVKLLYTIPDYQNPTGSCMPIANRLRLLQLADQYNFLIIEDSVYNSFTYEEKKNPTLKSLDRYNRVIYVGSFSKSLFPGLRIGLVGAGQQIENETGKVVPLIEELVKVKAQITNNTSTVNQAVLGGILLDSGCSLHELCKPKFESYKMKRDAMINSLNKYIRAYENDWARDIGWNEPKGGFFIKVSLPFEVTDRTVMECARDYKIIFCPMRYFYLTEGGENAIRLTFSNLSLVQIEQGVMQLADFLRSTICKSSENFFLTPKMTL